MEKGTSLRKCPDNQKSNSHCSVQKRKIKIPKTKFPTLTKSCNVRKQAWYLFQVMFKRPKLPSMWKTFAQSIKETPIPNLQLATIHCKARKHSWYLYQVVRNPRCKCARGQNVPTHVKQLMNNKLKKRLYRICNLQQFSAKLANTADISTK